MKQYEAVIETIERLGGVATLGELNREVFKIKDCKWNTKTPFASIRRIVQTTNGIGMVATDNDVYQSIREYYVNYDPDKMNPQPKQNKPIKKKTRTKTEPKGKFTELDKKQTQNSAEVEELTLF